MGQVVVVDSTVAGNLQLHRQMGQEVVDSSVKVADSRGKAVGDADVDTHHTLAAVVEAVEAAYATQKTAAAQHETMTDACATDECNPRRAVVSPSWKAAVDGSSVVAPSDDTHVRSHVDRC